jgi:hypothetical protein
MALSAGYTPGGALGNRKRYNPWGSNEPEADTSNTMNAYRSSIPTQGANYDEIMQGYRNVLGQGSGESDDLMSRYKSLLEGMGDYTDIGYQESGEQKEAFKKLRELSETGGLNEAERGDLRARGISPIRAVYANMEREMGRNRSLSGGYSPSYNATAARMAREGSESIAGATTNVNAKIAEMVQQGKLTAAPQFANLANSKTQGMNQATQANARNKIDFSANKGNLLEGMSRVSNAKSRAPLEALQGMTSLYGTTPALVNTFGNQVANQSGQTQNAVQNKQRYKTNIVSSMGRRRG